MNAHHLEKLRALRAQIDEELNALDIRKTALLVKAAAYEEAIAIISDSDGENAGAIPHERRPRGSVKDTVLRLIQEYAEHGLTAVELVETADLHGIKLDRGSVSSLLSKLKAAGTLRLDGSKYRPATSASKLEVVSGSRLFGDKAA